MCVLFYIGVTIMSKKKIEVEIDIPDKDRIMALLKVSTKLNMQIGTEL